MALHLPVRVEDAIKYWEAGERLYVAKLEPDGGSETMQLLMQRAVFQMMKIFIQSPGDMIDVEGKRYAQRMYDQLYDLDRALLAGFNHEQVHDILRFTYWYVTFGYAYIVNRLQPEDRIVASQQHIF